MYTITNSTSTIVDPFRSELSANRFKGCPCVLFPVDAYASVNLGFDFLMSNNEYVFFFFFFTIAQQP